MKFTLGWLKQHLDTPASLVEIADTLTRIGLEVEEIIDPGKDLAPFTVAHVVSATQHPNADRLRVCMVDTGKDIVQVVCGAPNARTGMKAVFAPSGSYIPGTGMVLKPSRIRDVDSSGMLCSEREMMLSDEHDGIIELDPDAPIGAAFAKIAGLDDPVIEIAITPNRPDALGVAGIARDLAAAGLGTIITPAIRPIAGNEPCPIRIETDDPVACPLFAGRLIRGVKNGPSPKWLQLRLKAIGLRPISLLVDITNYITYDRARPLHVYDVARTGRTIRARRARAGETLHALDGNIYETRGGECLIADDKGPLGFGGVMGGENSGVRDDTVNVFIESALFDPVLTAQTGRIHAIQSDARYRFERGVDPGFVLDGLMLATQMIVDLAGGTPSEITLAGKDMGAAKTVPFRPARVKTLGGLDVPADRARAILESLGFDWSGDGDTITVSVPGWRPDIDGEADIVEEVLRIEGYDKIPATPLPRTVEIARPTLTLDQTRARAVKRRLATEGLYETVTWSFTDSRLAQFFDGHDDLMLENPISSELNMMRPSILPNLITAASRNNDHGANNIALFEVGPAYSGQKITDQAHIAAMVRFGDKTPRHWRDKSRPVDAYDAKADALAALEAAGAPVTNLQVYGEAPAWYHPGRSGTLRLGPKKILAAFGELHPTVLRHLDMEGALVGAEVYLDAVPQPKKKSGQSRSALHLSNLPVVERDFAFIVARDVAVGDLVRAALGSDRKHIDTVSVFDVYEGQGIDPSKKSVGLAVHITPQEKTFTDKELEGICQRLVAMVEKATGGQLRR